MWIQKSIDEKKIVFQNNQTGSECMAEKIYTHEEYGNFYMFSSLMNMPIQRKYLFDLVTQNERIGIEKDELMVHLNSIKEFIRDNKPNDAYGTAMYIESKLKNGFDYAKTSLLTVALLVVQDGENVNHFNQKDAEDKLNLWGNDKSMLGFFLANADQKLTSFYNSLNTSSQTYLEVVSQSTEK